MKPYIKTYTIHEISELEQQQKLFLRQTEPRRTRKFRQYVMEQFMKGDIYIPPIVASENNGVLHIIDGNSRIRGLLDIFPLLKKMLFSEDTHEQTIAARLNVSLGDTPLAFQIFEGLSSEQCDQLYLDANTKGKKVALSKRIAFDSRNTINTVTNELLQRHEALRFAGIEQEKVSLNRPANKKFLSLSQLRAIVALFLVGKEAEPGIFTQHVDVELIEQRLPILHAWLNQLFHLEDPDKIGNYHISILASFIFVRALAYYALKGEEFVPTVKKVDYVTERMKKLQHISWETCQPLWERFEGKYRGTSNLYFVKNSKKTLVEIVEWLCLEGGDAALKA